LITLYHRIQTGNGSSQRPFQCIPDGPTSGVKLQRREADHSPPSSGEVKKAWRCTSTPTIRFHGAVSVKKESGGIFLHLRLVNVMITCNLVTCVNLISFVS
jgi:hypothetical protein